MSTRSKTGLMLVDNPKRFFSSFCLLRNEAFTAEEYSPVLASFTRKGTIDEKTRDTYFYMANILNLIEERKPKSHIYRVTPVCIQICNVINDKSKIETYQKYVKGLLLSNHTKGPIFRHFLDFTTIPRNDAEIVAEFGKVPSKTLVAFCSEAGLIVKYGGKTKSVEVRAQITRKEFFDSVVKAYRTLRDYSKRDTKMIYIPIDQIRDLVCLDLGLESYDVFCDRLTTTLDSRLGESIYLHGAPPQTETEFSGLFYKGRRYAYISIRDSYETR